MNDNQEKIQSRYENAYHPNPLTTADEILNNEYVSGTLTIPMNIDNVKQFRTIPFYLTGNFNFSLSNEWTPYVKPEFLSTINNLVNGISILSNSGAGKQHSQIALISKEMASVIWSGSEIPRFTIDTTFVCTQRRYNPVDIIKHLSASCLPAELDDSNTYDEFVKRREEFATGVAKAVPKAGGAVGKMFGIDNTEDLTKTGNMIGDVIRKVGMAAPFGFGYQANMQPIEYTTCMLQVGQWFKADNLVVESLGNIEFSKEVISEFKPINGNYPNDVYKGNSDNGGSIDYGFPLYVRCTITLRPITYITPKEFNSYFE